MEKPAEERRDAATVINGVMDGWVASALFADQEASGIKTALQEAPRNDDRTIDQFGCQVEARGLSFVSMNGFPFQSPHRFRHGVGVFQRKRL